MNAAAGVGCLRIREGSSGGQASEARLCGRGAFEGVSLCHS